MGTYANGVQHFFFLFTDFLFAKEKKKKSPKKTNGKHVRLFFIMNSQVDSASTQESTKTLVRL